MAVRQCLLWASSPNAGVRSLLSALRLSEAAIRPTGVTCKCQFSSSVAILGRYNESKNSRAVGTFNSKGFSTSQMPQLAEASGQSDIEIIQKIQSQLENPDLGRLFAIVHVSSNQRKVTTDDILVLQKHIQAEVGDKILLNKVLLVGSKDFTLIGRPLLSNDIVRVEATVIEKTLKHTEITSFYKRRKNFKRFYLHKRPLTFLRINSIALNNLKDT